MSSEIRHDWVSALVDGQLAGQELQDAHRKLAEAADAQKLFEQLQSLRSDLRSLPQLKLDANFTDRVMQQIGTTQISQAAAPAVMAKPKANHWRITFGVFSSVAALLLVGIVIFANRPQESSLVVIDGATINEPDSNVELARQQEIRQEDFAYDVADSVDGVSVQDKLNSRRGSDELAIDAAQTSTDGALGVEALSRDRDGYRQESSSGQVPGSGKFNRTMSAPQAFAEAAPEPSSAAFKAVNDAEERSEAILAIVSLKDQEALKEIEQVLRSSGVDFVEEATTEVEKQADEKSQIGALLADVAKDRSLGIDGADVLIVEAPKALVESVLDRLSQDANLEFSFSASRSRGDKKFTNVTADEFFAKLRAAQQNPAAGGGFGGAVAAEGSVGDQELQKGDAVVGKNPQPARAEPSILKLDESTDESDQKLSELELGDSPRLLKKRESKSEREPDGPEDNLSLGRPTARYLKKGMPKFTEMMRELAEVNELAAVANDSKESDKKAKSIDASEKRSGQSKPQPAKDSAAQAEELGAPRIANEIARKPQQMVRLYIVVNPNRAAAEATPATPDDN